MQDPSMYVKQIDPVIDLTRPVKLLIEEGAENVTYAKYPASGVSQQNIQFNNINPPNSGTIVDRKVFVKVSFRLTITGTGAALGDYLLTTDGALGTGGLAGGNDALRAFPLSQMIGTLKVSMNSQSFSQELNQYIEPLMRYSNYRDVGEEDWSMTPTMQDQYLQYEDYLTYGSARNALGNYGENGYRTPRGGFYGLNVFQQNIVGQPAGTPSTGPADIMEAYVDVEVTEPMYISPFAFGKRTSRGFYGLTSMSVTLNMSASFDKYVWSHNAVSSGKAISNISINYSGVGTSGFVTKPEITFIYYTPRMAQQLPDNNLYPYHDITDYQLDQLGAVPSGSEISITNNNIQLNSVPKRMFVFVKELESDRSVTSTDTYARIKSISMTFGNASGLLSNANEQQLYELSVRNGLKMSWTQWAKHVGSVLCIDFARNVSLDHRNVVGKDGSFQLQYTINIQNISNSAKQYTVNTVIVNDGYVTIDNTSVGINQNLGNIDQVYDSPLIHTVDWEDFEMFYGAGIADKIRSFVKKHKLGDKALALAKQYGPQAVNYGLSHIPGVGPEVGEAAEAALRLLASGEISGAEYDKRMKSLLGSGVIGGKAVGRPAMKKKLKRY